MNADLWGPLGVVLGALGIVVAFVVAWWFARGPSLVYQVSGTTVLTEVADERVSILFDGEHVPRITSTAIWIWREGRGTVRGGDVVETDPLAINLPGGSTILAFAVVQQTSPTNGVTLRRSSENHAQLLVTFDYLDPRQGAVIELLHTDASPDAMYISGTVRGLPKGVTRSAGGVRVLLPLAVGTDLVAVTIPTHSVPSSLRISQGAPRTVGEGLRGMIMDILRAILP